MASWPHWYAPNQYLPLFYAALAQHGIEHVPNVPLDLRRLRDARASAVHLHWVEWAWNASGAFPPRRLLAARRFARRLDAIAAAGMPIVWTVHNVESHERPDRVDAIGFAAAHARANLRIFHSAEARDAAAARYGGAGDCIVMPHGNYDGAFPAARPRDEVRRGLGLAPETRALLMFGDIRAYKGIDLAIDAVRLLPSSHRLIVAGRERDASVVRLLRRVESSGGLTLELGTLSDQRLADLASAADAVLLPYRRVTGSGALLAALTLGVGVVATSLPYFRELLGDGSDAAIIVPPDDARALAAGIERFFEIDPARRRAATRAVADHFSWPTLVEPVARWLNAHAVA